MLGLFCDSYFVFLVFNQYIVVACLQNAVTVIIPERKVFYRVDDKMKSLGISSFNGTFFKEFQLFYRTRDGARGIGYKPMDGFFPGSFTRIGNRYADCDFFVFLYGILRCFYFSVLISRKTESMTEFV